MNRKPLPRSRLNLWALAVIAQTVSDADHRPVEPTPRLRLAMAWLMVSAGEGAAMELFWKSARDPMAFDQTDYMKSYMRCTQLRLRLERVCERMGTDYEKVRDHAREMNAEWP